MRIHSRESSEVRGRVGGFSLVLVLVVLSACSRTVMLREYRPVFPAGRSPLAGKAVSIRIDQGKYDIDEKLPELQSVRPTEPSGEHEFVKMARVDIEAWDRDVDALDATTPEEKRYRVGWVRNGYGMHVGDVVSLVPPAQWIQESIATEVKGRGGTVLPASMADEADLVVGGKVRYLKVDGWGARYWADLLLDVEVRPKGGRTSRKTLHFYGAQGMWSTSGFEFTQPMRLCLQKLLLVLLPAMEKAVGSARGDSLLEGID